MNSSGIRNTSFQGALYNSSVTLGVLKWNLLNILLKQQKSCGLKGIVNDINAIWKLLVSELMGLDKSTLLKKNTTNFYNFNENIKIIFYDNLLYLWPHFLLKKLNNMDSFIQEPIFDNPHF